MEYSLRGFAGPEAETAERRVDVWFRAGLVGAFSTGEGTHVRFGGRRVAVYRDDGPESWLAFEDRCPRCGEAVMADGRITVTVGGAMVTCPRDGATFHIGTRAGEPSIRSIPVVVEDEHVFIGFRYRAFGPAA